MKNASHTAGRRGRTKEVIIRSDSVAGTHSSQMMSVGAGSSFGDFEVTQARLRLEEDLVARSASPSRKISLKPIGDVNKVLVKATKVERDLSSHAHIPRHHFGNPLSSRRREMELGFVERFADMPRL
jgi:hypothetical protein